MQDRSAYVHFKCVTLTEVTEIAWQQLYCNRAAARHTEPCLQLLAITNGTRDSLILTIAE